MVIFREGCFFPAREVDTNTGVVTNIPKVGILISICLVSRMFYYFRSCGQFWYFWNIAFMKMSRKISGVMANVS